jgi:hypothetical protein
MTGRGAVIALVIAGLFAVLSEMFPDEVGRLMFFVVFLGVVVAILAGGAWLGHRLGRRR